MAKKPSLQIVSEASTTSTQPPRTLGNHGRSLWNRVLSDYDISDSGGLEILAGACAALDRAERLREQIDADGEVLRARGGAIKDHPGLKHELANRAFVARSLSRLGLDVEPVRNPGRPPRASGWTGEN